VARRVPGPYEPAEMDRFLASFMYREDAFLVDEVLSLDAGTQTLVARLDTRRRLPFASRQRVDANHPRHVSAAEILMVTGSLGCLHAWFFHGCRWDEGWVGFGSRVHRADFKALARIGPPLELHSRETRARVGERRVVLRYAFRFTQGDSVVYVGDQTAMFVKDHLPD
jgi:hypothetical protein